MRAGWSCQANTAPRTCVGIGESREQAATVRNSPMLSQQEKLMRPVATCPHVPRLFPALYVAFELGNSEWVLAMMTRKDQLQLRRQPSARALCVAAGGLKLNLNSSPTTSESPASSQATARVRPPAWSGWYAQLAVERRSSGVKSSRVGIDRTCRPSHAPVRPRAACILSCCMPTTCPAGTV